MAEAFTIASHIIRMAHEIKQIASDVKYNKKKCQFLCQHVETLSDIVVHIQEDPAGVLGHPLKAVQDTMNEVFNFVQRFNKMGRLKHFVHSASLKDEIALLDQELNTQLAVLQAAQSVASRKDQGEAQRQLKSSVPRESISHRERLEISASCEEINHRFIALANQRAMPKHVVGLQDMCQSFMKQLKETKSNVLAVLGMGGIGKTTLMTAIYAEMEETSEFEAIGWVTLGKSPDLLQCQKQIWEQLVGCKPQPVFGNPKDGCRMLSNVLQWKNVFLVVDDVWRFTDIEHLMVVRDIGKVVFTSRKVEIAKRLHADQFELGFLQRDQSHELFNWWAFGSASVPEDKEECEAYAVDMADECGGLPLALTIIGSLAAGYGLLQEWKHGLRLLRDSRPINAEQEEKLLSILQSSFEDLDQEQKMFFLTFAAYSVGYRIGVSDLVEQWVAFKCDGNSTKQEDVVSLEDEAYALFGQLLDRSLIQIDKSGLGRFQREDVDVLMAIVGFEENGPSRMSCHLHSRIHEMVLMLVNKGQPPQRDLLISSDVADLGGASAKAEIMSVCDLWPEGMEAKNLKVFVARESELTLLPQSLLNSQHLVAVDLSFSALQSLTPEIGKLRTLKLLRLDGCCQLQSLPLEIIHLDCLTALSLRFCASLRALPQGFGALKKLSSLYLAGSGLEFLPDSIRNLQNLRKLDLSFCGVLKKLPCGVGALERLEHLSVAGCSQLMCLPEAIGQVSSLVTLSAAGCVSLEALPKVWPRDLRFLDLQGCRSVTQIPKGIWELSRLRTLHLQGCRRLEQFPNCGLSSLRVLGLPLLTMAELIGRRLDADHCRIQFQNRLNILGRHWYLENGTINKEWLEEHNKKVEWQPKGAQYNYLIMKEEGKSLIDIKLFLGGQLSEKEHTFLDLEATDDMGRTSLHHAAMKGNVHVVMQILSLGGPLDVVDKVGNSALMKAIKEGHTIVVEKLLDHGANVDIVNMVCLNYRGFSRFAVVTRRICRVVRPILGRVWLAQAWRNEQKNYSSKKQIVEVLSASLWSATDAVHAQK